MALSINGVIVLPDHAEGEIDERLAAEMADDRRLWAIEAAARAYYDAYQQACMAHALDTDDWSQQVARTSLARQAAQDALFAALDADYDPTRQEDYWAARAVTQFRMA